MNKSFLMRTCAFLAMPLAATVVPSAAQAQQITASVDGQVNSPTGAPVAGAQVTITDTRTNSVQTYSTADDGRFSARNLTPGGPYTISVTAPGLQGQTVENVITSVASTTTLSFNLSAEAAGTDNAIVVTAQRANVQLRAIGPGTAFGADSLEGFPSINRDVRDIVRIDPRVSLDRENEVDRVSCLGGNDRSNTFTVDGVVQADVFGLNGTPFAARNALPIPYDAIRETSVEFAPFDVEYGQFTGCAINVVTKSGQNRFHGSAFYVYNDESLTGSTVEGETFDELPFKDTNWGATLSGPIFRDRLFFFLGYEEVKDQDSQEDGPTGGGFPNEEPYITVEQAEEIGQVLSSVYGIDPGPIAQQLNETNRRYFGRIDANITDDQRLELTYQKLEERNVEPDDFFGGDQFTALNAFEEEGTNSDYYSARLYSQWTDNFSTELRLSRAEVADVQGPVGGGEAQSDNPTPRFVVGVENDGEQGLYLAGPGQFRSANQLDTKVDQAKLKGELDLGAHVITVGGEINKLDVFNLFIVNATGTLVFQDIDALREGILTTGSSTTLDPGPVLLGNRVAGAFGSFTASGDPAEAAAEFGRTIYSAYAQDDWSVNDQLNLLAGVRLEWYDGDAPRANPNFLDRYGFSNAVGFDVLGLTVLPRLGATYDLPENGWLTRPQLKGGVGLFAGGDPTVWFSNAFSNNGFASGFGRITDAACAGVVRDVVVNGTFTGFPDCVREAAGDQAAQGLNRVQSTDPNLELPTVLRANLGFSTGVNFGPDGGLFDGWRLNLDYIYSRYNNPYDFVDLSQTVNTALGLNGATIDGRPIYRAIDPTRAGCTAQLVGTGGQPPRYENVNAACFTSDRDDEIQLTNAEGYSSQVASVILAKRFAGGVFGGGGSTNFTLGYAFTDSNNRRDLISAQSTSNFDSSSLLDRQNPGLATSGFETRHNFTAGLNFRQEFFAKLATQFGMFFGARSGRPFSYTFDGTNFFTDPQAGGSDNAPLYVPTGIGDPNMVYLDTVRSGSVIQSAEDTERLLNQYISDSRCLSRFRGRAAGRNACRNDWYYDLDLRLSQELPGVLGGHRAKLFVDFDNFLNFVNSDWNVLKARAANVDLVDLVSVDAQGRYVVRDFNPDDTEFLRLSSSVWRIQVGARYEF